MGPVGLFCCVAQRSGGPRKRTVDAQLVAGANTPPLFAFFLMPPRSLHPPGTILGFTLDYVRPLEGLLFDTRDRVGARRVALVLRMGLWDPGRALKTPNLSPEQTLHHFLFFFEPFWTVSGLTLDHVGAFGG